MTFLWICLLNTLLFAISIAIGKRGRGSGMVLLTFSINFIYANHSDLNCNRCCGGCSLADQPLHSDAIFHQDNPERCGDHYFNYLALAGIWGLEYKGLGNSISEFF